MNSPLLTIAIPTYNRAELLSICLESILSQLDADSLAEVELLVSDNASTDNTEQVVEAFAKECKIFYFKNKSNLGFDGNFIQCFDKSHGKYLWVFSDDDLLLPGALLQILSMLRSNDYGVLQLGAVGYIKDVKEVESFFQPKSLDVDVYNDPMAFFENLNYMATFITGIIVNKTTLAKGSGFTDYVGTNLVQVSWVINGIFSGMPNAHVKTETLACKHGNSGGYKFITTFSEKYNVILKKMVDNGYDKRIIDITNRSLITEYFPSRIKHLLYGNTDFENEQGFQVLFKCFKGYPTFWTKIFPIYFRYWLKRYVLSRG